MTFNFFKQALCAIVAMYLAMAPAAGQDTGIKGLWMANSDTAVATIIEIDFCETQNATLCAWIVEERPIPGEPTRVGELVGEGIIKREEHRWTGTLISDTGMRLPASITSTDADRMDVQVCMAVIFCDAMDYLRLHDIRHMPL